MGPALVVTMVTLLTLAQPLATDLYLTALPAIRNEYGAPVSVVQLTLSVLVLSFGLSQLLWGPAADRFGRRPVMLAGLIAYGGGALIGALAPTIEVLIGARAIQGIGHAACMVCARALVRDLFKPQQGTHVMAQAMSLLAPMTMSIPVLGAFLTQYLGWRATLLAMTLFALATLTLVVLRIPETVPARQPDALNLGPLFRTFGRIARHPSFRAWTALNCTGYGANFGFFSSSAYLFIETYGVSRVNFGLVIGGASVAYLAGTFLCRRWIASLGITGSVRRASWMSLGAAALFIVPQLANAHNAATLTAGLWLMLLAYGVHQPCGHVGQASHFPLNAGAASALGGFLFAAAAFLSGTWLGFMLKPGSSAVLALSVGVLSAASGLIALTLVQKHGKPPAH
jgi:DHA1 family bicyclomycin/chloramphenicol resistance-like MFS transporter